MSVILASVLGNCINEPVSFKLTRRVTGHFSFLQEEPDEPQRIAVRPYSIEDGHAGNICSVTGNYFPGHEIVNVDGVYYSLDVANQLFGPKSSRPTRIVWK